MSNGSKVPGRMSKSWKISHINGRMMHKPVTNRLDILTPMNSV